MSIENFNPVRKGIYENINSKYFDNYNLSDIIYNYTELTDLQKAWKTFCIEKSLPDKSNYNDSMIINGIINADEDSVFQNTRRPIEFSKYLSNDIKAYLEPILLNSISFKYFNASLLLGVYDSDFIESEDLEQETLYDDFSADDDMKYTEVLINSKLIEFVIHTFCDDNLKKFKEKLDVLENRKSISDELYERIFTRVIELEYN